MPNYGPGPRPGGSQAYLLATVSQTLFTGACTLNTVIPNSFAGTIAVYDCDATASISAANCIATIAPNSVLATVTPAVPLGLPIAYNWPVTDGVTVMFSSTGELSVAISPGPSAVVT